MHGPRRAKDGPAPVIDCTKDIRRMSKEEREPFGYGSIVQIVMGNETVASVPLSSLWGIVVECVG